MRYAGGVPGLDGLGQIGIPSPRAGRGAFALAALAIIAFSAQARADEPKVEVVAEAVHASNTGNTIDPPSLAKLKLGRFTNIRRLSESKLTVEKSRPAEFKMPDGKTVTVRLVDVKNGVANFNVSVPTRGGQVAEVKYEAGKEPLSIATSEYQGGVLFLVLSPPDGAKPRRGALPALRPLSTKVERAPLRFPAPARQ